MRDRIAADTAGPERARLKQTFSLAPWAMAEFHLVTPAGLMTDSGVGCRSRDQRRAVRGLSHHGAQPPNCFGEEEEFISFKMHRHWPIREMELSAFAQCKFALTLTVHDILHAHYP